MSVLAGRTAVVTGAARGIGAALAGELAARGCRVALVGHEPEGLARTARTCGPHARSWCADVTDSARMAQVAQDVERTFGPADIVVANAGIAVGGPFLHTDAATFDRVVEVNLLGSVRTARAFVPQLVRRHGYLLQVASLAALVTSPMMAAYCASKSGVEAFAHSVGAELAQHGVGVGVAYLSWIDTDLVRAADGSGPAAAYRQRLPAPFNRTYPVAAAAAALADGVERRRTHVFHPRWVGAVVPVRGVLTRVLAAAGRREAGGLERALLAEGRGFDLVGAGGEADAAARHEAAPNPTGRPGSAGLPDEGHAEPDERRAGDPVDGPDHARAGQHATHPGDPADDEGEPDDPLDVVHESEQQAHERR
jgi:NAD(P)-dependent dehydrogenase (short-subunit alcohol dehydrogenase family)